MKCDRILNAQLIHAIAAIGHTQSLVICDAGLPIPKGVPCIDLSLVKGIPSFESVLHAVADEMVVERVIYADECEEKNPAVLEIIRKSIPDVEYMGVPHEMFKELSWDAVTIVRTGECMPYSNAILVAGVNF